MTREQMTAQVDSELERIPRGDDRQNELRAIYNVVRRRSLGKNAQPQTPAEVLQYSIDRIKESYPSADLEFDAEFFGVEKNLVTPA